MSEEAKLDYKANDMLNRGIELLQVKQEDRALKLISSVPRMFPKSAVRFRAYLVLGTHHMSKRQYALAVKQFRQLENSEDPDHKAEGLYQIGVCHYNTNEFDKAFMSLRKVTSEFPWSIYANEAYYTGGAAVHVVKGIQGGGSVKLGRQQQIQSVLMNIGYKLQHFAHHEQEGGICRALVGTAKYGERIRDIIKAGQEGHRPVYK